MRRKTPLRRLTRLARVNRKRLAKRRAAQFGEQAELCRRLPCVVCCCSIDERFFDDVVRYVLAGGLAKYGPSDPHHTFTRGSGRGLDKHCVPLCRAHHGELDIGRLSFDRKHGVDLRAVAARLHAQLGGRTG